LTLYTTPVVYFSLDQARSKMVAWRARRSSRRSAADTVSADPGKPQ
jgi:hypothetical protein